MLYVLTCSATSSTTTLPPTSQLVPAYPAVTRVRMYDFYEYKGGTGLDITDLDVQYTTSDKL